MILNNRKNKVISCDKLYEKRLNINIIGESIGRVQNYYATLAVKRQRRVEAS